MKKLILFLLILVTLVFIFLAAFDLELTIKGFYIPRLVEKKEKYVLPTGVPSPDSGIYQCSLDEDCVLVPVTKCCGFVAVNKNFKDEIKPAQMMCLRECYSKAFCIKGVCQVSSTK